MADQAALQEAIQRARQLAAKISQNAPAVKRTASELDDHSSIGTVKVTLAYEKPPNSEKTNRDQRSSSNYRDNNNYNKDRGDRDRDRSRDSRDREPHSRDRDGGRSRDREDSLDSVNAVNNNNNNNNNSNNGAYPRGGSANPASHGGSMLGGIGNNSTNNYSSSSSADARIEIIIPHAVIGLVIGKGGENIKKIQNETGATVRVDPNTVDERGNKVCTITGTKEAVEEAHSQVSNVIENAATNKRPRTQVEGSEQYRMKIPASRTGAIIGKGGETIKFIKQQSGCDIELDKGSKDCGPDESIFIIRGTQDKIQKARNLIEQRLASRGRDGDRDNNSHRSGPTPKGVATGANAAPVAQFTDLPAGYPASGQQTSGDMSAAWAAYFAQYSNLYNQTGAGQVGGTSLPYAGQSLLGTTSTQQVPQPEQPLLQQQHQHQQHQHQHQQQHQQPQQPPQMQTGQVGQQQDYSDQWIEYYMMNGRPDYAEMIMEMKKQQGQKQQPPPPPQ